MGKKSTGKYPSFSFSFPTPLKRQFSSCVFYLSGGEGIRIVALTAFGIRGLESRGEASQSPSPVLFPA